MASDENLRGSEPLNHLSDAKRYDPAGTRITMECDRVALSASGVDGSIGIAAIGSTLLRSQGIIKPRQ
jgi:hypothetical protein